MTQLGDIGQLCRCHHGMNKWGSAKHFCTYVGFCCKIKAEKLMVQIVADYVETDAIAMLLQGSFNKYVTKQRHSVSFPNTVY